MLPMCNLRPRGIKGNLATHCGIWRIYSIRSNHRSLKGGRACTGLDPGSATPDLSRGAGWGSTGGRDEQQMASTNRRTPTRQHSPRRKAGANAVDLPLSGGGMESPPCGRAICDSPDPFRGRYAPPARETMRGQNLVKTCCRRVYGWNFERGSTSIRAGFAKAASGVSRNAAIGRRYGRTRGGRAGQRKGCAAGGSVQRSR
jgi:hypothetical protein